MSNPLKTRRILIEVFGGFGAGVLLWFLMIASFNFQMGIMALILSFILILFSVILAIKLIKKGYKIFGIMLLVFLVPAILLLLLIGACTGLNGSI